MHIRLSLLICLCASVGCLDIGTITPLFDQGTDGGVCPKPPDLAPVPAKCAAAKGLAGDVLSDLCLDMDKIDTAGLMSRGFDLKAPGTKCAGWAVSGGKLQPTVIDTSTGAVNCGLSLPNIPVDAKYSKVTLALVQQANLPDAGQQTRMELFAVTPLRVWVNPTTTLNQRTTVEIDRASIPGGPNAQVTLQLLAPISTPTPSWTISSIAVLGQTAQ